MERTRPERRRGGLGRAALALLLVVALGVSGCTREEAPPKPAAVKAAPPPTSCQVYLAGADASLNVVVGSCATLSNPGLLKGEAVIFLDSRVLPYAEPLVSFETHDGRLSFQGHLASKLAGVYVRLEEARRELAERGTNPAFKQPLPVVYPAGEAPEAVPDLLRIVYSPARKAILLRRMDDDFSREAALAPGLAARAYFEAAVDRYLPERPLEGEASQADEIGRKTRRVLIAGHAAFFGALVAGSADYADALAGYPEARILPYRPLDEDVLLYLVKTPPAAFNPTAPAVRLAGLFLKTRETLPPEARPSFDKAVLNAFFDEKHPLRSPNPDLAAALEFTARRLYSNQRDVFCKACQESAKPLRSRLPSCASLQP